MVFSFLGIDEKTYRNLLIFDQNIRTVYSSIRTVYPSKNHVTTHPELSNATNSLFPSEIIVKIERTQRTAKQNSDLSRNIREWKLTTVDPQERSTWRSGVRSAMRAASQLPGKGPTDVMMPLHLHVNQKSDYDMI